MSVTCPQCGYVRRPQEGAPNYECPRCGVLYAKAVSRFQDAAPQEVAAAPVASTTRSPTAPVARFDRRQKQILIAAVVASFVIGYFAGREHLKYEMRSAIENATAGLRSIFGGGGAKSSESPPKAKVAKSFPVTATLLRKGVREREYGRSEITFAVTFTNSTGKDVRAFDGVLTFTDLLGNEIYSAALAVNDPVAARGAMVWEGKLDYNQFMSPHERLRNAETENTKVIFALKKVLFADGQMSDFQQ